MQPGAVRRKRVHSRQAVDMSTVDDMSFLKLMVGSLVPGKKEPDNAVEHFFLGHVMDQVGSSFY